jgi:catechol 2,3-dioxygenase-like lactoylglutathione lyase family enzyme
MFSHIMLGANDIQESKKFYDAILAVLGCKPGVIDAKGRCFWYEKTGVFSVTKPIDGQPATHANGSTYGFSAKSSEEVDAWYQAGIDNGGTACEDAPGLRSNGTVDLYLAYLRDPAGNKVCALFKP